MTEQRPPLPPFTRDSAIQKVRAAEDGWNSRDAEKVALAYTVELAARAAVLAAALPALGRLLKYLGEIAAL